MRHDRNAALGEKADSVGHAHAAFDLDRAALGLLDHPRGVVEGLRGAFLVGAKRHVDDDQSPLGAAHHGPAMHDHQVERHRKGRLKTVHDHAKRVADQDEIDIAVGDGRRMGMIGGERHDRLASLAGDDLGGRGPRRTLSEPTSEFSLTGEGQYPHAGHNAVQPGADAIERNAGQHRQKIMAGPAFRRWPHTMRPGQPEHGRAIEEEPAGRHRAGQIANRDEMAKREERDGKRPGPADELAQPAAEQGNAGR